MQVLMHTGTENISMARVEEKTEAFEFIRNLLTLLLQVYTLIFSSRMSALNIPAAPPIY